MVVLDPSRLERRFEMWVLLDPNDMSAPDVDEARPPAEEVRATALERTVVGRIHLHPREAHAHDDAIGQADRPVDSDVVVLSDALGEHLEHAIAADDDSFLAGGHPLDARIEHPLERREVAGDERPVTAQEKLDARVAHEPESMELNGALSNPFEKGKDPVFELFLFKRKLLERKRPPYKSKPAPPRTVVPITQTITQVLELANFEAMRVKDIHKACEQMLNQPLDYRGVKTSLSAHCRGPRAYFTKVERGWYRLSVGYQTK